MARYSLDANILSYILRKDEGVVARFEERAADNEMIICPVADYEVRRWLIRKNAQKQLEFFRSLDCSMRPV